VDSHCQSRSSGLAAIKAKTIQLQKKQLMHVNKMEFK